MKNIAILMLTGILLLLPVMLSAQAFCSGIYTNLSVNHLNIGRVQPNGTLGQTYYDQSAIGMRGAGPFSQYFWVSNRTDNQIRVSRTRNFDLSDFRPGPYSDSSASNTDDFCRFWQVTLSEIQNHLADWADNGQLDQPEPNIVGWPGKGNPHFQEINGFPLPAGSIELAPFVDVNGDGIYNAFDGDYPHPAQVAPDVEVGALIWTLYTAGPFNGNPAFENLPLEFSHTIWAFACTNQALLNQSVWQSVTITNRGTVPLDSILFGIQTDFDLGNPNDDEMGTNPALQTVYAYNQDNDDESIYGIDEWGINPPAEALTILNQSLYKTMIFNQSGTGAPIATTAPSTPVEYDRYLNGFWRDGTPLSSGASGYAPGNPVAQPADFMFDGNPLDSDSWAMSNLPPAYADKRVLSSLFIGNLQPGEARIIDFVHSLHHDPALNNLQQIPNMFDEIAVLKNLYAQHFAGACTGLQACTGSDCVWPGDTNRDGIVDDYDYLPISASLGKTGPPRPGFLNWNPQEAGNWDTLYNQSYDLKHVDANGDGAIDINDYSLLKSSNFYGKIHPPYTAAPDEYPEGPQLHWAIAPGQNPDSIVADHYYSLYLSIDNAIALKGLIFSFTVDDHYFDQVFLSAYHAADPDLYIFSGNNQSSPGYRYLGVVNTADALLPTGLCLFLGLHAKNIPDGLPDTVCLRLKNIRAVQPDGSYPAIGATPFCFTFAAQVSAAQEAGLEQRIQVYPNPATRQIQIKAEGDTMYPANLIDATGRVAGVFNEAGRLDTGLLPRGVYWVSVLTERGRVVKRVVLE